MPLLNPKSLDIAYLKTGISCHIDTKAEISSKTLNIPYLKQGCFVGYQIAAPPIAEETVTFNGLFDGKFEGLFN